MLWLKHGIHNIYNPWPQRKQNFCLLETEVPVYPAKLTSSVFTANSRAALVSDGPFCKDYDITSAINGWWKMHIF